MAREASAVAASQRARRVRRVNDWTQCLSGGSARLLEQGTYEHPELAALDPDGVTGVLLFKAGVRVIPETLIDLDERVAECGYVIAEGRMVPPRLIRERGLARRHYYLHQTIAERGALRAGERLTLLRIYDNEGFRRRYGPAAAEVPVIPVHQFLAQTGIPVAEITRWSEACARARGLDSGSIDAANELSDCKYVNVFRHETYTRGAPVFLLNPHMPSVVGELEGASRPLLAVRLLAASHEALPWADLRKAFCGASDPARALPGSLRRDAYDGIFPLRLDSGEPIDRTHNGVHLSDGPIEALRETAIWLDRDPAGTPVGRALARGSAIDVHAVIDRPFIEVDGRCQTLKQAIRGKTIDEAREILARGRLLAIDEHAGGTPTLERADLAHALARDLAVEPRVRAVIVTGDVAGNRAVPASTLDVIVVVEGGDVATRTEQRTVGGVAVRMVWIGSDDARAVARGDGRSDLCDASDLIAGLPAYDPDRLQALYERETRAGQSTQVR